MDANFKIQLLNELAFYQEKINAIKVLLNEHHSKKDNEEDGYKKEWSLKSKFIFIIKINNRFMHSREIADQIIERENIKSKDDLVNQISRTLSQVKGQKKIGLVSYQEGKQRKNSFWGFESWLDGNGKIKPEHKYNDKYFSKEDIPGMLV